MPRSAFPTLVSIVALSAALLILVLISGDVGRRNRTRLLLIVQTCIFLLLFVPATLFAAFAPMVFDRGASTFVWAQFLGLFLLPVILVASPIAAWVTFMQGWYRLAAWTTATPLLWLAYIAILDVVDIWSKAP